MKKFDKIKDYYMQNTQPNQPDYCLLGWESEFAQQQRFDALINDLNLHGKRVLDVGCGTGNLLQYLEERFSNFEYTGVDILEYMIAYAKSKKTRGRFICADIFKENPFGQNEFDVIFASGTFNINLGNNKKFLIDALRLFNYICKETISFNLLDNKSPNKENKYFYSSSDEICALINDNYPNYFRIKVIKGYLKNDFTIVCNKENNCSSS